MRIRIVGFAIMAFLMVGCEDDQSTQRVGNRPSQESVGASFRIRLLNARGLTYGDSLHFEVKSDSPDQSISKLEISGKDDKKPFVTVVKNDFKVASHLVGGGEVRLKFKAIYEDGKSTTRYKEVVVKPKSAPAEWKFEVVQKYPHDVSAYTQGFLVYDGYIYEGTGNYGESKLRKLDLTTGEVVQEKNLNEDVFGEGITIFKDKIYQVTYKSGRGFVYDRESFAQLEEFSYYTQTSEGWGLTHNDTNLILSDGSSVLYFLDPNTREVRKRLNVFDENGNVTRLNELEFSDGKIFANIYTEPYIVELDAETGQVMNRYTAMGIVDRAEANSEMDVLNGIAIHPLTGNLLVTGKYWSKIYEVKPVPLQGS
ncbi:MAG TPA: glutaminyl-peptide cyclotransferase [Cryomorphaceae bacterium]|nr:glutaminyl-peptide cyclotransferase [Cryomorphaceae bacterium]